MYNIVSLTEKNEIITVLSLFSDRLESLSQGNEFICKMAEKFSINACFRVIYSEKNDVMGFSAFYCNDNVTKTAYLSMIAVLKQYGGKGIGSLLLSDFQNISAGNGMKNTRLEVNVNNESAIYLYNKHGFIEIERNEKSVFMEKKIMKTPEQLRADFWKEDELQGSVIRSQYDEIKRVLADCDMKWAEERLLEIKKHAIENTEFYKNYTVDDKFPVCDKMAFISDYEQHKAKGGFQEPIHTSSTSGSTGTPFTVIQDFRKRKRNIADLKVFGERCDYPSNERMVFFRVLSEKLHRTPEQEDRENIYYIDSSKLDNGHLQSMIDAVIEKKPRIVFSYSSTLVELGKYAKNKGYSAKDFSMSSLLIAGEGILEPDRKMLEEVFGCKLYRRYSDMEMGILGQDMGNGSAYELNWGSYYFECLKMHSDEPTEDGEIGRIVITDLFNRAFPMIRYDTGDLASMIRPTDGRLPYYSEIYGRVRDCVYSTDGGLVSAAKISVSMWGMSEIKQWQFIQETQKGYVLKLNCENGMNTELVINRLKDVLGDDAEITVEYVEDIPVLSSNKRRAVICNYQKENS